MASLPLGEGTNGPIYEIADLLVSCVTRWADERCIAHKEGKAPDLEELDRCMTGLVGLFPAAQNGIPPRRCGHSFIVHADNRTGKELLKGNLDRWAHEVTPVPFDLGSPENDIPF